MKPDLPFQAAIFDMDGLLLNTEQLALDSFDTACQQMQLPDVRHVFYQCVGTAASVSKIILRNGLAGIADSVVFRDRWEVEYQKLTHGVPLPLMEGVNEILSMLHDRQIPLAVATSTKTDSALSKLKHSGIYDFFEIVIGGDQVAQSKPEPDIYLKAATTLGVDPGHCIAFEDSPNGVRAAVAAGMTVVQVPNLIEPSDELRKLGHIILDSLLHARDYEFPAP